MKSETTRHGALAPAVAVQPLLACHTPDPDDAFAWWAIATGRVAIEGGTFDVSSRPIQQINEACLRGELDIAAISSAAYPSMADRYAILAAGASVGRGYGPALATRDIEHPCDILGATVAVPGDLTTGALLLRLFFPDAQTVSMPFDAIAPALLRGEVAAGVLIHEELLNWEAKGLRRLLCLGQEWLRRTNLPLPVGLNVVRRDLGHAPIRRIATAIRESMAQADLHRDLATAHAMRYSIQAREGMGEKFIRMFANEDTLCLDAACRRALRVLFDWAHTAGLTPAVPRLEFVDAPDRA